MAKYDFSGYATRNDLICQDGRTIRKDAFKGQDGVTVPLVWNHNHTSVDNVLGHALLENRDDGVYAYCSFNDTESGRNAKELLKHGDVRSLSIFANKLKHSGRDVVHGMIREVSLVLAGANPGAFVDEVVAHGETLEDACVLGYDESITLYHSDGDNKKEKGDDKTIEDIVNSMTDEQRDVMYAMVGMAKSGEFDDMDDDGEKDEGDEEMKHNVFEQDKEPQDNFLCHSDQQAIVSLAKEKNVGSLQTAISMYLNDNESLAHGVDSIETLFPEYQLAKPGAPDMVTRDQTWVDRVISRANKSPISRVRTRQADVRAEDIRGKGYKKGEKKGEIANWKLITRTTDPQTIFVKDALHRDDITDIVDFDIVEYQHQIMRMAFNEELATAILIGDGRDDGDEAKISPEHIRDIWHDNELYTIHTDVDIVAAKKELQGSNTSLNYGDNYIYAEAIITAALYAREKYKGSGSLDFYCTPHLLNVMLLAKDLNGRRIYESKADLAAALNVNEIYTVEQFEGKTRTFTPTGETTSVTKKLLGLFINLQDYQIGATKGGEITNFSDFDIDFNQYKYLMEARCSGALTRVFSAIALEEPVTSVSGGDTE